MATQKVCDRCKQVKPDVKLRQISIVEFGVVTEGMPTGTTLEADVCDDCRDAALTDLHEDADAKLKKDIPIHKEMIKLRIVIGDKERALRDAVRARDDVPQSAKDIEKVAAQKVVDDAQVALDKAEADYTAVANQGA